MPRGRPMVEDESSDRTRIEAAQRDPRLFAELYEANFDRVYAYVTRRVRDRAEAQEITAEVFHHALENLARFEWRGVPFAAWLYRIAAHAIADRARLAAKQEAIENISVDACLDSDIDEAEERALVFREMRELPDDQRRVIEMRFIDEKSIRDIAKEIGRSEGAVKQLQFRGLQTLRDRMGGHHG